MYFFFFSSRRRHTRFDCDWSSDVCSSDLSTWATLLRDTAPCRFSTAEATQARSSRSRHPRSEEHTSELQSQSNLVCRLLLEKKKKNRYTILYSDYLDMTSPTLLQMCSMQR